MFGLDVIFDLEIFYICIQAFGLKYPWINAKFKNLNIEIGEVNTVSILVSIRINYSYRDEGGLSLIMKTCGQILQ